MSKSEKRIRKAYSHLTWHVDPKSSTMIVEAVDQYGRWYHVMFQQYELSGDIFEDQVTLLLRALEKRRLGLPADGHKGVMEGRYVG